SQNQNLLENPSKKTPLLGQVLLPSRRPSDRFSGDPFVKAASI
ncbi:hypothetical protein MTO96_030913, partial [Rhipicephalus appendiculatus]